MPEILVTYGEIAAVQAKVMTTMKTVNGELEQLRQMLNPMVATWTGEASTHYQAAKKQWDESAAHLNQILGQIGGALEQANTGYQQVEKANAGRWA